MATSPSYIGTPKFVNTIINNSNAGDPAYSAPTTVATVLTVGATGARIDTVYIAPVGTNAATSLRFWVDTVGTGGANNRLVKDIPVPAATSTTVASLQNIVWSPGLVLPANSVLRCTVANTAVTNGVCVNVAYGEF